MRTLGQPPVFTATLAALRDAGSSPQTTVMIGVPAGETAGHYEAGFGEGDENRAQRRFFASDGKGGSSKNNGLAVGAQKFSR